MKPFDLLNAPLAGVNLIEASAGTGKTYNIEGLFMRLILERQLRVDQILVLTFTKAATEELRVRIRRKLVLAKDAFGGKAIDDLLIKDLIRRQPDSKKAGRRLHEALVDFDLAAVFTIHGFCQRVLHENAFETQSLFDTELITNQNLLIQEVVDDFWRRSFYQLPLEFIGFCLKRFRGPQYFYHLLSRVKNHQFQIIPDPAETDLHTLSAYREAIKTLKSKWPDSRQAVAAALQDPALSGVVYGSPKPARGHPDKTQRDLRVNALVAAMDQFTHPLNTGFPLFDNFERLTTHKINQSTRKNQAPPAHEFFDQSEAVFELNLQLEAEMQNYLVALKSQFFSDAESALRLKKKNQNIQYFDDLLLTLLSALQSDSGTVLAKAVRQKYKAALVDEFQDTDNTQYEILMRLFAHSDGLLFMIGDPKQAIYSFRGADIFSYMKAAERAAAKFTLTKNWRSQPELIGAVNAIFGRRPNSFVFDEISFQESHSATHSVADRVDAEAGLTLWYLDTDRFSTDAPMIPKAAAVQLAANAVRQEIQRLSGSTTIEPGDMAVLVRTNDQAQLIKKTLSHGNIPAVLYSTENVFDSHEAEEIQIILSAITDFTRLPRLKAALATEIMGFSAEDLISGELQTHGWDKRLARFREYHQIWNRAGLIRMFRQFLTREQVKPRLLCLPDGERRLTNVLHLAEILHRHAMQNNSGMFETLKWLAEQRDPATTGLEEYQLRLESDEKAVKIVTIHKSKGLEYPIVFCPFAWKNPSSEIRNLPFTTLMMIGV